MLLPQREPPLGDRGCAVWDHRAEKFSKAHAVSSDTSGPRLCTCYC